MTEPWRSLREEHPRETSGCTGLKAGHVWGVQAKKQIELEGNEQGVTKER